MAKKAKWDFYYHFAPFQICPSSDEDKNHVCQNHPGQVQELSQDGRESGNDVIVFQPGVQVLPVPEAPGRVSGRHRRRLSQVLEVGALPVRHPPPLRHPLGQRLHLHRAHLAQQELLHLRRYFQGI